MFMLNLVTEPKIWTLTQYPFLHCVQWQVLYWWLKEKRFICKSACTLYTPVKDLNNECKIAALKVANQQK